MEIWSDFICLCDEEGREQARLNRERLVALFAEDGENFYGFEVTSDNLLTSITRSLDVDYYANIKHIFADQWFGVVAESSHRSFRTTIQCDTVEDGLIATWLAFYDRFGRPTESS